MVTDGYWVEQDKIGDGTDPDDTPVLEPHISRGIRGHALNCRCNVENIHLPDKMREDPREGARTAWMACVTTVGTQIDVRPGE